MGIDLASPLEIAEIINREDQKVAESVEQRLDVIAEVIELVSDAFQLGGRLLYFGAGTSGRLGILDAAECPPTFGSPPEQVQGFIAGGKEAMFVAQEGAEDDPENGIQAIDKAETAPPDVVCGLAASGRTPYVHGALNEAKKRGCKTVFVTTVPAEQIDIKVDYLIDVPVGPEVIMGSTRMKSATAQKMVLNMITTGAFVRQGKIYENVMVDLMLTNKKLVERAKRIITIFADVDYERAGQLLEASGGHVKTALLMALKNLNASDAKKLLSEHNGFVRKALLQIDSK
ncbi:N-acetylmuramic acid 6-phosphate etherase [Gracilimonas mengyeensis]|uniref:N-acetylmuramic acid 6-phosphate etherase n=2 Tax=Gracilimonas mengyeensis TaxID=1302730 RepID=A0A521ATK8_9BACT|nr:N-acetylmuramic acid 6-phosphate etherase [Gracilimonas mengyeensis]